jgi:hypothetical protein
LPEVVAVAFKTLLVVVVRVATVLQSLVNLREGEHLQNRFSTPSLESTTP